jgi:MFS family permease
LALFSLSFLGFAFFATFALLVIVRLYMGVVYSVCGSATMTLAGDVLPQKKVGLGINRFVNFKNPLFLGNF